MSCALPASMSARSARHGRHQSRLRHVLCPLSLAAPEFSPRKLYADLGRAAGQDDDNVFAMLWTQRQAATDHEPRARQTRVRALPPRMMSPRWEMKTAPNWRRPR